MQSLGILIGFGGLSAFYYFGKIGELSTKIISTTIYALGLHRRNHLEIERAIIKIKKLEAKAKKLKYSNDFINNFRKNISDAEELKSLIKKEKEKTIKTNGDTKELIKETGKNTTLNSVLSNSFFIISLVTSLIWEITGNMSFLTFSISLLGFGVIFMLVIIIVFNDFLTSYNDVLEGYQLLTTEMKEGTIAITCMVEESELLFDVEDAKK